MSPDHRHTPDQERQIREAALDETIEGTLPASDPPSSLPNPDDADALTDDEQDSSQRARARSAAGTAGQSERHASIAVWSHLGFSPASCSHDPTGVPRRGQPTSRTGTPPGDATWRPVHR